MVLKGSGGDTESASIPCPLTHSPAVWGLLVIDPDPVSRWPDPGAVREVVGCGAVLSLGSNLTRGGGLGVRGPSCLIGSPAEANVIFPPSGLGRFIERSKVKTR